MQYPILSRINGPDDVKTLDSTELNRLAGEIRELIVATVAQNGGHLASNLGVVELSIALHRVFDSPRDMIIWDVGHQSYAHKLLTGRYRSFENLRKSGGLSGFPRMSESPHDHFNTGHASTSISAALGLLAAERLGGGRARAVAVIGDGALTGGMAYEALSHAGQLGLPLVVILNDNKMSISPNVGGLSKYLSRLSTKAKYQTFRRHFDAMAKRLPIIGNAFYHLVLRLKRAVKAVFYTDNFFVDLGFEYVGPIDGHNITSLSNVLKDVRQMDHPVVVHVVTRKGKGYSYAEDDPGKYHGVGAFSASVGINQGISFTEGFGAAMLAAAERDNKVVALTAAMEKGTGLSSFKKLFPRRFFDVGIAEEHAVTFACALAAKGLKPVVAIYSTFIQRAADQIIHDSALQNLPITLALDRSGFVGEDGLTHQGVFDIALFRSVPNVVILAPASEAELCLMLDWALEKHLPTNVGSTNVGSTNVGSTNVGSANAGPVLVRYPKACCPPEAPAFSLPLERGRGVFVDLPESVHAGSTEGGGIETSNAANGDASYGAVCLAFTGSLYPEALGAAALLADNGIRADLYNLRFIKPVDEDYLTNVMNKYELVVFVEEGIAAGGFGEYAAALAQARKWTASVCTLAVEEHFASLGTREELLRMNRMDAQGIAFFALRSLDSLRLECENFKYMGRN